MASGVSEDKIVDDTFDTSQYFGLKELPHVKDETFVDIGVFDGASSLDFVNWTNGNFKHIYCFEPDRKSIPVCRKNLSSLIKAGKLTFIEKGAWSRNERLKFNACGTGGSSISDQGDDEIEVVALDEVLSEKRITYIKMDVEGAEEEVIKGAKKIISEQKPKMAVCIYHKFEDVLQLPALLLEYNPDYKFYVRHYTAANVETVLYAI